MAPDVECDGEMHGDAALSETMRRNALMDSKLEGEANILICPNLDAANILFNVLKITGGHGVTVGPILLGAAAIGPRDHAVGHGTTHRQHDGAGGGRCGASRSNQALSQSTDYKAAHDRTNRRILARAL